MKRIALILSIVLYIAACFLPALSFHTYGSDPTIFTVESWMGGQVLGMGWMGAFVGVFGWYANPFWLLGNIASWFKWRKVSIVTLIIALLLSLSTFMLFGKEVPGDEANVKKMMLDSLQVGAYLWFASIGVSLIQAFMFKERTPAAQ